MPLSPPHAVPQDENGLQLLPSWGAIGAPLNKLLLVAGLRSSKKVNLLRVYGKTEICIERADRSLLEVRTARQIPAGASMQAYTRGRRHLLRIPSQAPT